MRRAANMRTTIHAASGGDFPKRFVELTDKQAREVVFRTLSCMLYPSRNNHDLKRRNELRIWRIVRELSKLDGSTKSLTETAKVRILSDEFGKLGGFKALYRAEGTRHLHIQKIRQVWE